MRPLSSRHPLFGRHISKLTNERSFFLVFKFVFSIEVIAVCPDGRGVYRTSLLNQPTTAGRIPLV